MIHVVGLLARAGHGKTTLARYLEARYKVKIVSLASPLKKIAKAVFSFTDEQLYGTQAQKEAIDPRYGFSPRIALQRLGTEGIRENLGPDVWCESLRGRVREDFLRTAPANDITPRPGAVYAVDDERFPNEAEFIVKLDQRDEAPRMVGHNFKIVCTDAPPSGNDNHPSEAGIDLVPPEHLSATIVSSRALGIDHLIGQFEEALSAPSLSDLRKALRENGRT